MVEERDITEDEKIYLEAINTRSYRHKLSDNLNYLQNNNVIYLVTKNDKPLAVTLSLDLFARILIEDEATTRLIISMDISDMLHTGQHEQSVNYSKKLEIFAKQLEKSGLSQNLATISEIKHLTNLAKTFKGNKPDIDLVTFDALLVLIKGIISSAMYNFEQYNEVSEHVTVNSLILVEINGEQKTYFITDIPVLVDPFVNIISTDAPLGKALLEKSKGEKVYIKTREGELVYKIMKIV